jgi:hypothetical protein
MELRAGHPAASHQKPLSSRLAARTRCGHPRAVGSTHRAGVPLRLCEPLHPSLGNTIDTPRRDASRATSAEALRIRDARVSPSPAMSTSPSEEGSAAIRPHGAGRGRLRWEPTESAARERSDIRRCEPPMAKRPTDRAPRETRSARPHSKVSDDASHGVRCLSASSALVIVVCRLASPAPSALRVSHPLSGLIPPTPRGSVSSHSRP